MANVLPDDLVLINHRGNPQIVQVDELVTGGTGGAADDDSITFGVQKHIVRRFLGDSSAPMIEAGGESDGSHDALNSTILQAVADSGYVYSMRPGSFYRFDQRINFETSGGGIEGLGSSRGTLYMPASAFDSVNVSNTYSYADGTRYGSNAVGLLISGGRSGSFTPVEKVRINGITVQSEVSDGRMLVGIAAHNGKDIEICGNELFGFPLGDMISAQSLVGDWRICDNYIHDCLENSAVYALTPAPNITAIHVAGDELNAIACEGGRVTGNRINSVRVGSVFRISRNPGAPALQEQSDGINVAASTCRGTLIADNVIWDVGEGTDCFGVDISIVNNIYKDCYIFGIKLIHAAQNCLVKGNIVRRAGLGGIVLAGGSAAQFTDWNRVSDNIVTEMNPNGVWDASTTYCIGTISNTTVPKYNAIVDNTLRPGANGKYATFRGGVGPNEYQRNQVESGSLGEDINSGADTGPYSTSTSGQLLSDTHTPTVTFGGGSTGMTLAGTTSARSRILGDFAMIEVFITFTAKGSSTGVMLITVGDLPDSLANFYWGFTVRLQGVTSGVGDTHLSAIMNGGDNTIRIDKMAAGAATQLTHADITDTTSIILTGVAILA